MLLAREEIQALGLLNQTVDAHFSPASYDLTAAEIITLGNQLVENINIAPRGMAVVINERGIQS